MRPTTYQLQNIHRALEARFGAAYRALSLTERSVLARDVFALMLEEDALSIEGVQILSERIGGDLGLRSYVDTLMMCTCTKFPHLECTRHPDRDTPEPEETGDGYTRYGADD